MWHDARPPATTGELEHVPTFLNIISHASTLGGVRVLVTGGAGYIGSHTVVALAAAGHEPVIADNYANSSPLVLPRLAEITGTAIEAHRVELTDAAATEALFADGAFDAVIHFAGLKAAGESTAQPIRYYRNNLDSTLSVLEAMARHDVHRFVFSSSATVYGDTDQVPMREDQPTWAVNPYGQTKLVIERILTDAAAADPELRVALLRYFNPVGAHESGLIGEDPKGIPNNLVPFLSQVAVGRRPALQIFGDDYPTPDGTCIRDYVHVVDLAEGHVAALDALADRPGARAWNLGTGVGSSVLEVVRAYERAIGRDIPIRIVARRPGDAPVSYADPSRAATELGWRATRDLDRMCVDTARWQQANPFGYEQTAAPA